jgi:hypothetical protein
MRGQETEDREQINKTTQGQEQEENKAASKWADEA